jgi:hypothetical protein
VLLSIMGHGRYVQTGDPISHLYPGNTYLYANAAILRGSCG